MPKAQLFIIIDLSHWKQNFEKRNNKLLKQYLKIVSFKKLS